MKEKVDHLDIIRSALGTFEHRHSFTPGMFDPLTPLFRRLGYDTAAVYIADDYPDRMMLVAGYGGEETYPPFIMLPRKQPLIEETAAALKNIPNLMVEQLFNHERELGVIAATTPDAKSEETREAFKTLAGAVSIMAYVERIRTNSQRERQERDIFFAQSLISRLLVQDVPKIKHLRIGCEHIRSLEAGGDFFDFVAKPDGSLLGFVGSCSGSGLRTVLEVCGIMREIHRSVHKFDKPSQVLERINTMLVEEKQRRHQASLCLFHVSAVERKIRLAKSGRLGMLLCGPGGRIENISAPGATFLGMVPKLEFHDDEYEFEPGQSLFCVTEGFYAARDCMNQKPQLRWFLESVATALESKRKKPLANAIFDLVNKTNDFTARPDESMLALSVEFLKNRESVRIIRQFQQPHLND